MLHIPQRATVVHVTIVAQKRKKKNDLVLNMTVLFCFKLEKLPNILGRDENKRNPFLH